MPESSRSIYNTLKCLKPMARLEFFLGRNELARNLEGLNSEIEVSGQETRGFLIAKYLAWWKKVNALIITQFGIRGNKLWRKRKIDLKVCGAQDSNLGHGFMEVEDRASTIEYPTIYHRMTHNFAKESFCNEDHMKKYVLPGVASIARSVEKMGSETTWAIRRFISWSEWIIR